MAERFGANVQRTAQILSDRLRRIAWFFECV
jgi:hypothetical protein